MKQVALLFLFFVVNSCFGQVVFLETFDEADDAIAGIDNSGGAVAWTTTCPGSVAIDDYFKVLSGKLEGKDTNSPGGIWETGLIDISSCLSGISISFIIEELSNMEECIDCGGTGAPCIDWVKLEYNLDGGGWAEVAGVTCPLIESPGEMIQIGDIPGGGPIVFTSPCIDFGTTLQIRLSCMCWAAAEIWRFDDITVSCLDCVLPVQVVDLQATETSEDISITWSTLNERSNDYFTLERSSDGQTFELLSTVDGAGNSSERIDYHVSDLTPKNEGVVYYRLKQYDIDGKSSFSKAVSIQIKPQYSVRYANQKLHYTLNHSGNQPLTLNIYTLNGQLTGQHLVTNSGTIPWTQTGFFIVEVPELDFHQKLHVVSTF